MGCKGGWIQGARRVAKGGKNLWKKMPVLCQEYMLFFCLPRGPVVVCWALADYSMANRKIAYTLGRGRAYIFDMSSTSGYMGEKYFQEFGPRFFDMSSASGYMGEKYFQEFGPRFLACHVIFGVSCSKCCVSWRVNINRVNNFHFVSCQNCACQHVHAMSWPPWG